MVLRAAIRQEKQMYYKAIEAKWESEKNPIAFNFGRLNGIVEAIAAEHRTTPEIVMSIIENMERRGEFI